MGGTSNFALFQDFFGCSKKILGWNILSLFKGWEILLGDISDPDKWKVMESHTHTHTAHYIRCVFSPHSDIVVLDSSFSPHIALIFLLITIYSILSKFILENINSLLLNLKESVNGCWTDASNNMYWDLLLQFSYGYNFDG